MWGTEIGEWKIRKERENVFFFYNNFASYIVNITVSFGIWTSSHQSSEWENTDVGPWGG